MDNIYPLEEWLKNFQNGCFLRLFPVLKLWTWDALKQFKKKEYLEAFPAEDKLLALKFYRILSSNLYPPQDFDNSSIMNRIPVKRYRIMDDMFYFLENATKPTVSTFIETDIAKFAKLKGLDFSKNELCESESFVKLIEFLCKLTEIEYVDFSSNRLRAEQECWIGLTKLLKQENIRYINIVGNNSLDSIESDTFFSNLDISLMKKLVWVSESHLKERHWIICIGHNHNVDEIYSNLKNFYINYKPRLTEMFSKTDPDNE